MRIHVTNINTSDSTELEGHTAPILGLSLDPKEEFVVGIIFYHFINGERNILNHLYKINTFRHPLVQMDLFEYGVLRKSVLYIFGIILYQNVTPFLLLNHIARLLLNVQMGVVWHIHLTKI